MLLQRDSIYQNNIVIFSVLSFIKTVYDLVRRSKALCEGVKLNEEETSESVGPLTPLTHACTETRQEQVQISIDYDLRMLYYHIGLL